MLASTVDGDVFVWGCGLTYQLGNRPRDVSNPADIDDEPEDELRPYRVSSKQLEKRFVMTADGGAQHTVELAWDTSYSKLTADDFPPVMFGEHPHARVAAQSEESSTPQGNESVEVKEPPAKRRHTEPEPVFTQGPDVEAFASASFDDLTDESAALPEGGFIGFGTLMADDGKWKCEVCSLRWEKSVIKCKACDAYQPGLSEDAIAAMEAEKEARQSETIAMFKSPAALAPTGFSFGAQSSGSTTFGASAAPVVFGFSQGDVSTASSASTTFGTSTAPIAFGFSQGDASTASSGSTTFGTSTAPVVFGFSQADASPPSLSGGTLQTSSGTAFGWGGGDTAGVTFGFGGSSSSVAAPAFGFANSAPQRKVLTVLPDFSKVDEVLTGDVFVHGSGECDQLGLGDDTRERKKPTLLKALVGKQICEIAVGAMHVLCVSAGGGLYSWGCNDDGALGRASSDGSDGGPSDVEPCQVSMPNGVAVRKVSCGDCHSCALDDRARVWLWGTYKDSNGYIGIVNKRKQDSEVLEKSPEPTLVLEGCSVIASGANHTVALVDSLGQRKPMAWGSNATGQLGLSDNAGCGFSEKILSGSDLDSLKTRDGGGCEVDAGAVVRVVEASGSEKAADKMTVEEIRLAASQGASLVVQLPDREVPKPEKKKLLHPQEMCLTIPGIEGSRVDSVFASAECTFITAADGSVYGCGLNGDGQVGLGFASMAVQTLRPVRRVKQASWLGGGLHSTAALANGSVYTWGKAEECGLGLGEKAG